MALTVTAPEPFNPLRLAAMLRQCTTPLRLKPAAFIRLQGRMYWTDDRALVEELMTREDKPEGLEIEISELPRAETFAAGPVIDLELYAIGVREHEARRLFLEILAEVKRYPYPDDFVAGTSYLDVARVLGDEETALRLFALGEHEGWWTLVTPGRLGVAEEAARWWQADGGMLYATNARI
jgi:hypothetical protein